MRVSARTTGKTADTYAILHGRERSGRYVALCPHEECDEAFGATTHHGVIDCVVDHLNDVHVAQESGH